MFFSSLLFCCMSLASMNLKNLSDTQGNLIKSTELYRLSYQELSNIRYNDEQTTPPTNCELPDIFKDVCSLLHSPNGNGGSANCKYHEELLTGDEIIELLPTLNYNTVRETSIRLCEPLPCIIL